MSLFHHFVRSFGKPQTLLLNQEQTLISASQMTKGFQQI